VDNFTSNFENQIASRLPFSDLPSVKIPTRRASPRSHRPGLKLLSGITTKEPLNLAQELADEYDLSMSDILPSTGNPVWDDVVKDKMGDHIWSEVTSKIKDIGTPLSRESAREFRDKGRYGRIMMLKDLFRNAAENARQEAREENPMLWDLVERSRRDYREVLADREDQERLERQVEAAEAARANR